MKQLILIFIFLLTAFVPVLQGQQAQFDRATTLLEEQKYAEAIKEYNVIHQNGHVSGALWLNMGVAYAQLDSLGKARYYFLRAGEFDETKKLANQSLDVIENRFSRRSAILPMLPWDRFFNLLAQFPGITGLMVIGLISLNITAAFLLAAWFWPRSSVFFKRLSMAMGILSFLFMLSSIYLTLQEDWYDIGVTIEEQATVYDKPDIDSPIVSTAYEGYTMRVHTDEQSPDGDWHYVRMANGLFGWIEKEAILTY